MSDMERIVETAKMFNPKVAVCINKFDTNNLLSEKIEKFCREKNLDFVGKIPFDPSVVKAVNAGRSIAKINTVASKAVKSVYEASLEILLAEDRTPLKVNKA